MATPTSSTHPHIVKERDYCGGKAAIDEHVMQAALARREHPRHAGKRRRELAVRRRDTQPAGPFGDQHVAVGQERQRPWMRKPADHGLDRKLAGVYAAASKKATAALTSVAPAPS